jgi:hypothetical protein
MEASKKNNGAKANNFSKRHSVQTHLQNRRSHIEENNGISFIIHEWLCSITLDERKKLALIMYEITFVTINHTTSIQNQAWPIYCCCSVLKRFHKSCQKYGRPILVRGIELC